MSGREVVFRDWPTEPKEGACTARCDHAPTGRYKGGHDLGGGMEASVVLEERECGAWCVVQATVEPRGTDR